MAAAPASTAGRRVRSPTRVDSDQANPNDGKLELEKNTSPDDSPKIDLKPILQSEATMRQANVIRPFEVIQGGDTFLIRFECPVCDQLALASLKCLVCDSCQVSFDGWHVIDPGRNALRCLVGTRRKPGRISKKIVRQLMDMQEKSCAYCFNAIEDFHVDHIIPLSFGGTNSIGNLCLSCPRCNLIAGASVFSDIAAKRGYIASRRQAERG